MDKPPLNALDAIAQRRSIRAYKDIMLEWDMVAKIVEAAKTAPSSGNLQNWKFILVTDAELRKDIAEACAQQYWMATAPVHICTTVIWKRAQQYYGIRGERLYSIQNASAAMENMLIAATSLGIGSCWVSAFDDTQLRRVLSIPDYATPMGVVTLGYADEKPPKPTQFTIEHVSSMEVFGNRIRDLDIVQGYFGNWLQKSLSRTAGNIRHKIDKMKKEEEKE